MGLKLEKIENQLRYMINGKKAKRTSNKWLKNQRNRLIRRKSLEESIVLKERKGYEF
jgi:hypothetical protein